MDRRFWLLLGIFALLLLPGCRLAAAQPPFPLIQIVIVIPDGSGEPAVAVAPPSAAEPLDTRQVGLPSTALSLPTFTNVAAEAGVALAHLGAAPVMPLGGGVAMGDYDNDGLLDLYVTNQGGANALYQNRGDGTFVDRAADAAVTAPTAIGAGALWADYDNDGWRDLYVVNLGPNLLYHNNGDGTFTDVTVIAGVGDDGFGQSAAWGDYDNDGLIDLYVVNHEGPNGSADRLYHNEGRGLFRDVSYLFSHHLRSAAGFVATFVDYDDDGDVDLYVVNDKTFGAHRANVLWQNEGASPDGTWRFRDVSTRTRANTVLNGMGLAVGDFDNDADQDFAMSNIGPNVLLTNDGRGRFVDTSRAGGIERGRLPGDREPLTWCVMPLDIDNDGWLDLFFCGSPLDKGDGLPSALFHNLQNGTFADISTQAGFAGEAWTRAGAYGDYDNDGAVDFYVVNYNQPAALYRNTLYDHGAQNANWLTVRLTGVISNRDALGAKVRLTAGGQTQLRQIQSGGSLGAGNDLAAYFGLGNATRVDRLEITWPSGITQLLTDLPVNQTLAVTEEMSSSVENDLRLTVRNAPERGLVACGEPVALQVRAQNLGYRPIYSSQLHVKVTTQDGRLLLEEPVPSSEIRPMGATIVQLPSWVPVAGEDYHLHLTAMLADSLPPDANPDDNQIDLLLQATNFREQAFAAGFVEEEPGGAVAPGDFNGDGYIDLYLVNNSRPNLLYINQGDGTFRDGTAAAGVGYSGLGSGATVADFNQDGALDLYLLNLNEDNVYYQNRGNGTFVTMTVEAGLSHRGASRAAVTSDFDGDGDRDLYLVNDGQANVLFLNQGLVDGHPTFSAAPESAGLTDRGGGRNAVARDIDGDGDIDIYLVKDREANVLYLNRGDATFVSAPQETSAADTGRGRAAVMADFNHDGDQDLVVLNLAEPNRFYVNQGDGTFVDATVESGLREDVNSTVDAVVTDVNADGFVDLIVANAGGQPNVVYLYESEKPPCFSAQFLESDAGKVPNAITECMANQTDGRFVQANAAFGADDSANSVAVATADFNNDGALDFYFVNANLPDQLYLNSLPQREGCWE